MINGINNVYLKLHQNYYPFDHLSEKRAKEAADMIRFFRLKKGEAVTLKTSTGTECLYVISGSVTITDVTGDNVAVTAADTRKKPFQLAGEYASPVIAADADCLIGEVDLENIEYLIFWDGVVGSMDTADEELRMRMDKLRCSIAFSRLPPEKVAEAFRRMREVRLKLGEVVFKEGDEGETFYVLESGRAEVWRKPDGGGEPRKVAEISEGRAFGEESILTGERRNATIKMARDGVLLALDKKDFTELVSGGLVKWVSPDGARSMLEGGAQALDVRHPEEFRRAHIPGAASFPLHTLRQSINTLFDRKKYVAVCGDGRLGAVAALLLAQRGFDVAALEGGMRKWPYETEAGKEG
ncbi:MAG: cyclic nucleotide-binding domain-containing protein [Nitrospinae bacterium]|nr:cyclic nucleotide-binding domain-containing protein [Nitrospinota bacterium]